MSTRARVLGLLALVAVAATSGFQAGPTQSSGAPTPIAMPALVTHPTVMGGQALLHIRSAINFYRHVTWTWQDRTGLPHVPSGHAERHTRSWAYLHWIRHRWVRRAHHAHRTYTHLNSGSVPTIICRVFHGATCQTARDTAYRESRDIVTAWNSSDHGGLFQLGTGERATYATIGYETAYQQVVAAHNLWRARGWEPWTCCIVH